MKSGVKNRHLWYRSKESSDDFHTFDLGLNVQGRER